MTTLTSSSNQNIQFSRLTLQERLTRAPYGLAIYPIRDLGASLAIKVTNQEIIFRINAQSLTTTTISYVNKSVQNLVNEINSAALPILAVGLIEQVILREGDLFLYDSSVFYTIPTSFRYYDRLTENGIIIRCTRYPIKHRSTANFRVFAPYDTSNKLPWYPVISNGQFIQRFQEKIYHYSIPEYDSQTWSIRYGRPFKDVFDGKLTRISPNAYKLPRAPIFWSGDNVVLYNGTRPLAYSLIEDIDVKNGILYTKEESNITEDTTVSYSYLENKYEYRHININSHFSQNPNLLDKHVIMYAVPVDGISYAKTKQAIRHVVASSVDEAIDKIQTVNLGSPYVIIGGYSLNQVISSDRVTIIDTRSLGGGLLSPTGPARATRKSFYSYFTSDRKYIPIEDTYSESSSFWDIGNWDGEIYPGAAAITVSLPESLKDKMSKDDISARASKFIAAGVYTIIDYYPDPLPSVTGGSAQVSLLMNGSLVEDIALNSGVCWFNGNIEIPGSNITGSWPIQFPQAISAYRADNTGVISTGPTTSIYQTYLRSSPDAAIEYYTREVMTISGSNNDSNQYTPWTRVVIEDTRNVPDGFLSKGYLEFPRTANSTEIRSIKVNSPFRLDFTGIFADKVAHEIRNLSETLKDRTVSITVKNLQDQQITVNPILYSKVDITSSDLVRYPSYFGVSPAYKFINDLIDSDLEGEYTNLIDTVGAQVASSYKDVNGFNYYPMPFSTQLSGYYPFGSDIVTDLNFRDVIEHTNNYAFWRKQRFGTSDSTYTGLLFRALEFAKNINTFTEDSLYPKTYNISAILTNPVYSTNRHTMPELYGYGFAEINEQFNKDFEFLYMNPAMCSFAMYISDFNQYPANELRNIGINSLTSAQVAVSRFEDAIAGTRTFTGLPVVQNWYMTYNRHSKYLGSLSRQLIDCYEYIVKAQKAATNVSWDGLSGLDVAAADWYFSALENILNIAYPEFSQMVMQNGVLEREVADSVYSYGWYCLNKVSHEELKHDYYPHDHEAMMAGMMPYEIVDYRPRFSGIFETGLYSIIKGMTNRDATMYESTIVNGAIGKFDLYTPSKIFDPLSIGCKLNKEKYLPLAQAVFNTVTGNFSLNGMYYSNPTKDSSMPGHEDTLLPYLVRLYKAI